MTITPKKRYKPEEIVAKLRQVDVHLSQGSSVADAIRQIGVSEVTYYRWLAGHLGSLVVCGQSGVFDQALSGIHWSRY